MKKLIGLLIISILLSCGGSTPVKALQYVDMRFEHSEVRNLANGEILPDMYFCEIFIGDSLVWKFTARTAKIGQGVTQPPNN